MVRQEIKNFLSQDELDDSELLRKLVHGTVLSGKLHPLISEASTDEDDGKIHLRSMIFQQLLADGENCLYKYRLPDSDQKRIVAVGVRDLFLGK